MRPTGDLEDVKLGIRALVVLGLSVSAHAQPVPVTVDNLVRAPGRGGHSS
jgi:hypothetical protein